jgi:hypothetical protein
VQRTETNTQTPLRNSANNFANLCEKINPYLFFSLIFLSEAAVLRNSYIPAGKTI